jgi:flagellar biogenesis protein FliO
VVRAFGDGDARGAMRPAASHIGTAAARCGACGIERIERIGEAVRVVGALVVVVGIAFAAKWWLRRTGLAARVQGGTFEVIARQPVGRGQHVLVARFGPRLLCVQQTRDGLRTLSELTDPAEVAAALAQARGDAPAAGSERTVDLRRKDAAS